MAADWQQGRLIDTEIMPYVLLAVTIVLIASGQVAQKYASRHIRYRTSWHRTFCNLGCAPSFWVALLCMSSGLIVWLITLSAIEVSTAYPVLALSFVITSILSRVLLHENVSLRRWCGILLVTLGAMFMLIVQ